MARFAFHTIIVLMSLVLAPSARAACSTLNWSCVDSSVALVGRDAENSVKSFCSGVAVSSREVWTAGHCITSLSKSSITRIDVYLEPKVPYAQAPAAQGLISSLFSDPDYNRSESFYLNDRGSLRLDQDLPPNLNYPLLPGRDIAFGELEKLLKPGVTLERIGFGQRRIEGGGGYENRRTWLKPEIESITTEFIVTTDNGAMPGDSGGPIYLFIPNVGLVLVAHHSTWDFGVQRMYNPRIWGRRP